MSWILMTDNFGIVLELVLEDENPLWNSENLPQL